MAWYWIVAIVISAIIVLSFIAYIANSDMKLIEIIYDKLLEFHDSRSVDEKL